EPASQRVVREKPALDGAHRASPSRANPGPVPVGPGPGATRGGRVHNGPRAQDGVNLMRRRPTANRVGRSCGGVEPGHTISAGGGRDGAHAAEFSKTVAPLRRAASSPSVRARTSKQPPRPEPDSQVEPRS